MSLIDATDIAGNGEVDGIMPPTAHRPAVAAGLTLYHVVHPTDLDRDEWMQHYSQAKAVYERFAREDAKVHLHVETFRAGQYEAGCLLRMDRATCVRHRAVSL
jgi:hypothetical protein